MKHEIKYLNSKEKMKKKFLSSIVYVYSFKLAETKRKKSQLEKEKENVEWRFYFLFILGFQQRVAVLCKQKRNETKIVFFCLSPRMAGVTVLPKKKIDAKQQ